MINGIVICIVYTLLLTLLQKRSGIPYNDVLKSTPNLSKGLLVPVTAGTIILTLFAVVFGWTPDVFSFNPIVHQPILWVIPVLIIFVAALRFYHARWHGYTKRGIMYAMLASMFVAYSEELLVRGILTESLQHAGYSILTVGVISSVIFGLAHSVNYLNGQDAKTTSVQVIMTTVIGLNFFIALVISGTLWLPIFLHAIYDLSLFAKGGEINRQDNDANLIDVALSLALLVIPLLMLFFL